METQTAQGETTEQTGVLAHGSPFATQTKEEAPATSDQNTQTEAPKQKEIYLGGRKFSSLEEVIQYTAQLETEKKRLEQYKPSQTQQEILQTANTPKIEDLLFEDPASAIKLIKEDAKKEVLGMIDKQKKHEQVWNKFFSDYPDLKGQEILVNAYQNQLWEEIADLPPSEGLSKVALKVREKISDLRKGSAVSEDLRSGGATVASGSSGPGTTVTTRVAPTSFVDQLRKYQKRK